MSATKTEPNATANKPEEAPASFIDKLNETVNPILGWGLYGGTILLAVIIGLIVLL